MLSYYTHTYIYTHMHRLLTASTKSYEAIQYSELGIPSHISAVVRISTDIIITGRPIFYSEALIRL